jgi:osmoprotectant transport system ATP-binding protein
VTIQVHNVDKSFGQFQALDGVSLEVPGGSLTALLGPSGSGKSTLLRLLTGLSLPSAGEVLLWGQPLTARTIGPLRRRMGYVIQEGGLFPHLTAGANVTLAARYFGWDPRRIENRLEELCALTHFSRDGMVRFPAQLSGGQRQRVGLMRALMLDPPILLLDEPLGALDPIVRADLQTQLKRIFADLGKTVILVTHDIREAVLFGTTLTLMTRGRVVQQGTFADLAGHPADPFVSEFIGAQAPPPEMRRSWS